MTSQPSTRTLRMCVSQVVMDVRLIADRIIANGGSGRRATRHLLLDRCGGTGTGAGAGGAAGAGAGAAAGVTALLAVRAAGRAVTSEDSVLSVAELQPDRPDSPSCRRRRCPCVPGAGRHPQRRQQGPPPWPGPRRRSGRELAGLHPRRPRLPDSGSPPEARGCSYLTLPGKQSHWSR